jgi:hypothetical protein
MNVDVERIAEQQALMRTVNQNIRVVDRSWGPAQPITILCECGNACATHVTVGLSEYERVRLDPTHFLIATEHLIEEVDRPLEQHDSWLLVEARGIAAEIARRRETN